MDITKSEWKIFSTHVWMCIYSDVDFYYYSKFGPIHTHKKPAWLLWSFSGFPHRLPQCPPTPHPPYGNRPWFFTFFVCILPWDEDNACDDQLDDNARYAGKGTKLIDISGWLPPGWRPPLLPPLSHRTNNVSKPTIMPTIMSLRSLQAVMFANMYDWVRPNWHRKALCLTSPLWVTCSPDPRYTS